MSITLKTVLETLKNDDLLDHVCAGSNNNLDVEVTSCEIDSRDCTPGAIFICKGKNFRPDFLASAIKNGAVAFLADKGLEQALCDVEGANSIPGIYVCEVRVCMAKLPPLILDHPDKDFTLLGLTGTKGKSTTACILQTILETSAKRQNLGGVGIMGSISYFDGVSSAPSRATTPEAPFLWKHFSNASKSNLSNMVMEVSSQALKYDRTLGVNFDIACFLNIGLDHISDAEHDGFEDYFTSKLRIFDNCQHAVVNLDTDHLDRVLEAAHNAHDDHIVTFSVTDTSADFYASNIAADKTGVSYTLHTPEGAYDVRLGLLGSFNVSNSLAAVACAWLAGACIEDICAGLLEARVPGRMEMYWSCDHNLGVLVDFAHNKLSFETLFNSLSHDFPSTYKVAVFGAVGSKSIERRYEISEAAASCGADYIIFTTDDPWNEDPADICREMAASIPANFPHEIILDRDAAAMRAYEVAREHTGEAMVLLLAKGYEQDQHIGEKFVPCTPDPVLARTIIADYNDTHAC